jgi:hypothetical protein
MTETIEQAEDTTVESQPQTTPEQQLAIVKRQKQERLRVLAANDPIYQRLDGQDDVLTALTSLSNGKVPDDA